VSELAKQKREEWKAQELKNKEALEAAIKRGRNQPMLLEKTTADYKAGSNLSFLRATQKMVKLLQSQGEDPSNYLSREQKEALEEEQIKTQLKDAQAKLKR
jgi:glycosyltransferase A (GT-A) superfamily protein (DUF2064 family)